MGHGLLCERESHGFLRLDRVGECDGVSLKSTVAVAVWAERLIVRAVRSSGLLADVKIADKLCNYRGPRDERKPPDSELYSIPRLGSTEQVAWRIAKWGKK